MIRYSGDTSLPGTVGTAEKGSLRLHAVTQNLAATVVAYRGELVSGALEAVERMGLPCGDYLKG